MLNTFFPAKWLNDSQVSFGARHKHRLVFLKKSDVCFLNKLYKIYKKIWNIPFLKLIYFSLKRNSIKPSDFLLFLTSPKPFLFFESKAWEKRMAFGQCCFQCQTKKKEKRNAPRLTNRSFCSCKQNKRLMYLLLQMSSIVVSRTGVTAVHKCNRKTHSSVQTERRSVTSTSKISVKTSFPHSHHKHYFRRGLRRRLPLL